jgi:hypothetical protein
VLPLRISPRPANSPPDDFRELRMAKAATDGFFNRHAAVVAVEKSGGR